MNASLTRLRFKTGSSFAIAALGAVTFARLLGLEPLSLATIAPFLVAAIFVIAGLWRGLIYLQALRSLARP